VNREEAQSLRRHAWWAGAALLTLSGCHAAAAAARPGAPAPARTQVDCTSGAPLRLTSLLGRLSSGQDLGPALAQVYGRPINALTTGEADEALYLLSSLDSCVSVPPQDKTDVPRLVRLITLGSPNVEPLTAAPPPQSEPR
jgi:hypothetical protein